MIGIFSACSKDDLNILPMRISHPDHLYYYTELGEKIHMKKMDGQYYIAYFAKYEDILMQKLAKTGVKVKSDFFLNKDYSRFSIMDGPSAKQVVNFKEAEVVGSYENIVGALPFTFYWAPFYSINNHPIGITQMLIVAMKRKTKLAQVEKLAKKYSLEMIGRWKDNPNWYILVCTNRSRGNTLEMSARFYESGLFEWANPDLYGLGVLALQ